MRQTWRGNEREMVGKEKEREINRDRQGGKGRKVRQTRRGNETKKVGRKRARQTGKENRGRKPQKPRMR